jgi:predicted acetyltransferase
MGDSEKGTAVLKMKGIDLREPDLVLQDAYLDFCNSFEAADEKIQPLDTLARQDFAAFVQTLKQAEKGIGLPEGFVPYSTYWLVRSGQEIIGVSVLRYRLTPNLEDLGGHIGYRVHPGERRKGYGTFLLKMTLQKSREIGLTRVLVTCNSDNIASARVIQNNGGILASQGASQFTDKEVSRYWIELDEKSDRNLE